MFGASQMLNHHHHDANLDAIQTVYHFAFRRSYLQGLQLLNSIWHRTKGHRERPTDVRKENRHVKCSYQKKRTCMRAVHRQPWLLRHDLWIRLGINKHMQPKGGAYTSTCIHMVAQTHVNSLMGPIMLNLHCRRKTSCAKQRRIITCNYRGPKQATTTKQYRLNIAD